MTSKPGDSDNGSPMPSAAQRAELADVLSELRDARDAIPDNVKIVPAKPVSRQTARLLNQAMANFQRECNEIAQDACLDEGIDPTVYKLVAFTGQPAHWALK